MTGVTGYIGGDAVYAIANAHPEYEFTCLVRNSDKAASVAKDFGSFKFVYGDLDSAELIEGEAKKADIVLSMNVEGLIYDPANVHPQTLQTQTTKAVSTRSCEDLHPTTHHALAS